MQLIRRSGSRCVVCPLCRFPVARMDFLDNEPPDLRKMAFLSDQSAGETLSLESFLASQGTNDAEQALSVLRAQVNRHLGSLLDAAEAGHILRLHQLRDDGHLHINAADNDGWQALHYACWVGNLEVVQWLHRNGGCFGCHDKLGLDTVALCLRAWKP